MDTLSAEGVQELWCHACEKVVQFTLEHDLDGCHTIICPNCGHDHYRIVRDGLVTGDRWARSMSQYNAVSVRATTYAGYTGSTSNVTGGFLATSWANTTAGTW
jgi:hypothetical protein